MSYELNRSGIKIGHFNCFCMACNICVENRREAYRHIETSSHLQNVCAFPYIDLNNEKHNIRKFQFGFYCEFCDEIFTNISIVNQHIVSEKHMQNRGRHVLRTVNQDVITIDNVLISERAWHGLIENVCYICDTEFQNEVNHKLATTHVLGLKEKPVKLGTHYNVYRKIDESTLQCLTCNKLIFVNKKNDHFNKVEHIELIKQCRVEADEYIKYGDIQNNNGNLPLVAYTASLCKQKNTGSDNLNRVKYIEPNSKCEMANKQIKVLVKQKNNHNLPLLTTTSTQCLNTISDNFNRIKDAEMEINKHIKFTIKQNSNDNLSVQVNKANKTSTTIQNTATYKHKIQGVNTNADIDKETNTFFCKDYRSNNNVDNIQKHLSTGLSTLPAGVHPIDTRNNIDKCYNDTSPTQNKIRKCTPSIKDIFNKCPNIPQIQSSVASQKCAEFNSTKPDLSTNSSANSPVFCSICQVSVASNSMKEHNQGVQHKRNNEKKNINLNKNRTNENVYTGLQDNNHNKCQLTKGNNDESIFPNKKIYNTTAMTLHPTTPLKNIVKNYKKHSENDLLRDHLSTPTTVVQSIDPNINKIDHEATKKQRNKGKPVYRQTAHKVDISRHDDKQNMYEVADILTLDNPKVKTKKCNTSAMPPHPIEKNVVMNIEKHSDRHLQSDRLLTSTAVVHSVDTNTNSEIEDQYQHYHKDICDDDECDDFAEVPLFPSSVHCKYIKEKYPIAVTDSNLDDKKQSSTDIQHLAKENHIWYKTNIGRAYCRVCRVNLPSCLQAMNEHIKGVSHRQCSKKMLASVTTKKANKVIKLVNPVRNWQNYGFIVNDKYDIDMFSFMLFVDTAPTQAILCLLCEKSINLYQQINKYESLIQEHFVKCSVPSMKKMRFVTSEKTEFIRQIPSGEFHCGFCHTRVPEWSMMKAHLKTYSHIYMKARAYVRYAVAKRKQYFASIQSRYPSEHRGTGDDSGSRTNSQYGGSHPSLWHPESS